MAGKSRPEWLKRSAPDPVVLDKMKKLVEGLHLHTVCASAHCPNQGKCFARGVATFMILGDVCTRNCTFCAVEHGQPLSPDVSEPRHVVEAVAKLGLRHVVITSVTRDDLPDGGAHQFVKVIEAIRNYDSEIITEVLIPDFQGSLPALETLVVSCPTIVNHNVETVPRLYPGVRPQADYRRSIGLLRRLKSLGKEFITKSGLMVGLGEEHKEVIQVMQDLREAGCDFLTIGQYLRPSPAHHEVVRFVSPDEFKEYRNAGMELGFKSVASAPFVRSSFQADMMLAGSAYSLVKVRI